MRVFFWAGGGAAFFPGASGFRFDGPGAVAGAWPKRPLVSLEVKMVATLSKLVSPGVSSSSCEKLRSRGTILKGQGRRKVISPLSKI